MQNPPAQSNLLGILWMITAGLLFVAVTIIVRHLGSDLPAAQGAFIRYCFGLLLITPFIFRVQWRTMAGKRLGLFAARGIFHGVAVLLWFFAMARLPISEVTAIGYAVPLFTALGAILILGERVHFRRIAAIAVGFAGALVILRPGLQTVQPAAIAQVFGTICFAASYLFTKKLTRTEDAKVILVMLTIFCTLTLLPGALINWRPPTGPELFWLFLVAIFATLGHYAMTRAISLAPLTVTQPFSFLQLVWAVIFGFLMFSEIPDIWVLIGAAIIIAAVTYITHRESVTNKEGLTPQSTTPQ